MKRNSIRPKDKGKTSRKTGASRTRLDEKGFFSIAYLLKLSAVAVIAGVITAGLVWFDPKEKISRLSSQPIKEVQLTGQFKYVSKQEASELVSTLIDGSFIDLNIAQLKRQLEQHPWIESINVTREWPDKLKIHVKEQNPIAQWGKKSFLNMRGDIIEVEKTAKISTLPRLSGEDQDAREIMQQYLQMTKILAPGDIGLKSVAMDKTRAWTIELGDDVVIKLGREKILKKLQTFVSAQRQYLHKEFVNIQSIDMRYPSGFAVAWKNQSETMASR